MPDSGPFDVVAEEAGLETTLWRALTPKTSLYLGVGRLDPP